MIKGGGYLGARTRQPSRTKIKIKFVWAMGFVCRSTQTQSLTVVACNITQGLSRYAVLQLS